MKRIFSLLLIFLSLASFSEDNLQERLKEEEAKRTEWEKEQQAAIKRWRRDMHKDRQLIQKYFKGDLFKQFDKEIQKVLKSSDPGLFQNFFDDKNIDKLLKSSGLSGALDAGDFRWIETPKEKILILKINLKENAPFEIKIENNHIVIKGQLTETKEQKTGSGSNYYKSSRAIER
jgi:hypothetical protein